MKRSLVATLIVVASFIAVFAACNGLPPLVVTPQPTAVPLVLPDNEQDCLAQGGVWGPQGMLQRDMCDLPAADAGKACTDSSQCQGLCMASDSPAVGACSPRVLNFGCFEVMADGEALGLCID